VLVEVPAGKSEPPIHDSHTSCYQSKMMPVP
jgi:hypothetical protein